MARAINSATGFKVNPNTGETTLEGGAPPISEEAYGGPTRKYKMGGHAANPTQRMMGDPEKYFWGALVQAVPAVMGALGGGGAAAGGGGMLGGLLGGGGGGGGLLGGLLGGGGKKEEGESKGGMLGGLLGGLMEDGGQVPKNILASRLRSHMSDAEAQDYLDNYKSGGMIKRADGSYSKRGLWDNIRANKGSGKKPTAEMLKQERKINKEYRYGSKVSRYQDGSSVAPNQYTYSVSEPDIPQDPSTIPQGGYSTPTGTSIGLDGKVDVGGTFGNIFRMNQDKLMGMAGNLVGDGIGALLDTSNKPLKDRPQTKLFSSPTERRLSAVQKRLGRRDTQKKPAFNISI